MPEPICIGCVRSTCGHADWCQDSPVYVGKRIDPERLAEALWRAGALEVEAARLEALNAEST